MMIDIPYVRYVRAERANHLSKAIAGITGINGMRGQSGTGECSRLCFLEVDVWDEVLIVRSSFATRILHRKERNFVALGPQEAHEFEQVNFCTTEWVVVFIAEQNLHIDDLPRHAELGPAEPADVKRANRRRLRYSSRG